MITMLHHDAAFNPTLSQQGIAPGSKKGQPSQKAVINQAQHLAYLEKKPYKEYSEQQMKDVCLHMQLLLGLPYEIYID